MSPSLKLLISRALRDSESLSDDQKVLLWEGIFEVVPMDSKESELAKMSLFTLKEAKRAQSNFLNLLK